MGVWRSIRFGFSLVAMVWAFGASLRAQLPTATLNGIVSDPQGAAIVGARVVATNKATGISREATTGTGGQYVVTNLEPGRYDVRIEGKGFAVREYTDFELEVGRVGRSRCDSGGCIPALALPARVLRTGHESEEREAYGPDAA